MKSLALLVFGAAVSGCGSFTHFQSARSMNAGQIAYDSQASLVAMNEGIHVAARFRVGLGKGFEVGAESDIVSLILLDYLVNPNRFGLLMADVKWQILEEAQEDEKAGAPFSFAVGAGGGTGFQSDFYFGQATVSRQFGVAEPYLAWRYQRVHLDLDLNDPDDLDDLNDSYLSRVFEEVDGRRFGLHHVFIGAKFWLSEEIYVIPEVSWIFGDADGVGSIGLAIGIQTK